jgi:WhiB family redox-sensing transcriptional regulator
MIAWQNEAACADSDIDFFAEAVAAVEAAKQVCARCPVRPDCLSFAETNDERFGVWGGLSEKERNRARRGRPRGSSFVVCRVCGDLFETGFAQAKFCSHACRQAAYKQRGMAS